MSISGINTSVWPMANNQNKIKAGSSFIAAESQTASVDKSSTTSTSKNTLTEAPSNKTASTSNPAKELQDYMNMSDAEKMQYAWLNAHGISKQQFDSMSSEDKQKLLDQMRAELKQKMEEGQGKSGSINISV